MTQNKIVVTGGSGFIGSNLVNILKKKGKTVTNFDLKHFQNPQDGIDPDDEIIGDITDSSAIDKAVRGHDAIVHLAAQTGVPSSIDDPETDCITNVVGTFRVLEAARQNNIRKVVIASSAAPLGKTEPPASESSVPHPISPYGASKLAAEAYCLAYNGTWGIQTIALRFSNVYGPLAQHKESVVAKIIKDAMSTSQIRIDGTGEQTRDFIYVKDLCSAIAVAIDGQVGGEVFQIGSGTETSINELVSKIQQVSGLAFSTTHAPTRLGDVMRNYSDISKAQEILGWTPATNLTDGLAETWKWFSR